ncbi:MAG: hypothetical protein RLY86_1773 [Pseudomonadota bacterium]|jgi:beta-N-acetylhexosaminidase
MPRPLADAGHHLLIGLRPSPVLTAADRALLADLRPAGIVLFRGNFRHDLPYADWLDSHARLLADVRDAIGRDRILVAIDHEGGRVCRTPAPITRFAPAASWPGQAAAVGAAMGRELASLGVNLNFAPVLDINSNPANPVIGDRSFGADAGTVTAAGRALAAALLAQGVLPCAKHFPGHGDTDVDSHHALPVLNHDLDSLRARELAPFAALAADGIPLVMTSHILFPTLDAREPVTLSPRFITGLLRQELGFTGVVVTDDLGMKAVDHLYDDPAAAVRTVAAGCDLLVVCAANTDTERCRGFAAALAAAMDDPDLAPILRQSRARVDGLLARAAQHAVTPLPPDLLTTHAGIAPLWQGATAAVMEKR